MSKQIKVTSGSKSVDIMAKAIVTVTFINKVLPILIAFGFIGFLLLAWLGISIWASI